jgi:hypothetical protein
VGEDLPIFAEKIGVLARRLSCEAGLATVEAGGAADRPMVSAELAVLGAKLPLSSNNAS